MSLIDNFASLVGKHHKSMQDFQFVGTTLEASCKIYGLRVDSVHADVMNMAAGLGKVSLINNNDDANASNADANDQTSAGDTTQSGTPAKVRKAKRKTAANRCTVVKNTSTINAKLETYPLSEPTFAKLNTTIGDINSSKRLLNYVLSSVDSEIKHRSNLPFWDSREHPPCDGHIADELARLPALQLPGLRALNNEQLLLRHELKGYRISSAPAHENPTDADALAADEADAAVNYEPEARNQSHLDLAFDINADVEPIDAPPVEYMETGFDDDELDQMDADDMRAISAVRSLRRNADQVDDMRPVDAQSSQLEYSYRPLENISRFWAGPSYWKIQRPRRSALTNHAANRGSSVVGGPVGQQQRAQPQRRKFEPVEFKENFDASLFISVRSAQASKLRKMNLFKRWDPKKLRLPTDLHLDRQRYDKYFYAPGLPVEWHKEPAHSVVSQTAAYDYNNAEDREYCSNLHEDDDGTPEPGHRAADGAGLGDDGAGGGTDDDGGGGGMPHDGSDAVGGAAAAMEIGLEFAGAQPDKIEKIHIPFARRAKVVDMKQLKRSCLTLIERQRVRTAAAGTQWPSIRMLDVRTNTVEAVEYDAGAATFRHMLQELPRLLTADQKAATSTATAFYAILHLANDHELDLMSLDCDNFCIRHRKQEA